MPIPLRTALLLLPLLLASSARADSTPGADTIAVARIGAPQAILATLRGQALMVDVRYASQRAIGHIDGDLALRYDQVAAQLDRLPADRQLIFYCSCSHEEEALAAARAMPRPDDARIAVLVGGFDAWRRAGGPVRNEATWEGVFRVVDRPTGWGKTPTERGRCRYARDSTVAAAGRSSGCVTCLPPDSGATSLPGFSQRADAVTLVGRVVTLTAKLRTEGVDGAALLWLGTEDEQGKLMSFARSDSIAVIGTRPWTSVSLQIAVPGGAKLLDFGLQLIGAGRAWMDDVTLVAEPGARKPGAKIAVTNPGFED